MNQACCGHVLFACRRDCKRTSASGSRYGALYNATEHRPLATRFGHDSGVSILCFRSMALWLLGYPEAARKDADDAVKQAREIGQAATPMYALVITPFTYLHCGDYATANAQLADAIQMAEQKDALFWKAWAMMQSGCVDVLSNKSADAVDRITSGIGLWRSTGSTLYLPLYLTYLARALMPSANSITPGVPLVKDAAAISKYLDLRLICCRAGSTPIKRQRE